MKNHVLLFSDIHVHIHKRKIERLEDCLKTLEWVFKTAKDRNIKDIIFGGDLLHDRQKIESLTFMKTYEIFKKHCDGSINVWLLLGNHDLWYAKICSVSSVFAFSSLPGVEVIDQPCQIGIQESIWDFIPYTHDPIESLKMIREKSMDPNNRSKFHPKHYGLGHIALHGAVLNSAGTHADVVIEHDGDMVVVDKGIFKGYDHVFLGHYHSSQMMGDNVEYIGSPLQLSFGEAFQKKHIIDLNVETGEKEYIENTFSPKHLYIKEKDIEKYDLDHNFVTIMADDISATNIAELRTELMAKHNLGSLVFRAPDKKPTDDHIIEDAKAILMNEDEMLDRYVNEVGTDGLERITLMRFGKKVTTEKKQEIEV